RKKQPGPASTGAGRAAQEFTNVHSAAKPGCPKYAPANPVRRGDRLCHHRRRTERAADTQGKSYQLRFRLPLEVYRMESELFPPALEFNRSLLVVLRHWAHQYPFPGNHRPCPCYHRRGPDRPRENVVERVVATAGQELCGFLPEHTTHPAGIFLVRLHRSPPRHTWRL